jgi:hypothetical protein
VEWKWVTAFPSVQTAKQDNYCKRPSCMTLYLSRLSGNWLFKKKSVEMQNRYVSVFMYSIIFILCWLISTDLWSQTNNSSHHFLFTKSYATFCKLITFESQLWCVSAFVCAIFSEFLTVFCNTSKLYKHFLILKSQVFTNNPHLIITI